MGNAIDVVNEMSSERLMYRSWREPGNPDAPSANGRRSKQIYAPSPAFGAVQTGHRLKKSLSTGNLADSVVFPPGDMSLSDATNQAAHDGEEVDAELAAFRKLCHEVTALLIGPQFTTTQYSSPSNVSPTPLQQPPPQMSSSVQSSVPVELQQADAEPPKLVVNHLYAPVLQKVKEHLGGLPDWYLLKTDAYEAASHIRLLVEARKYGVDKVAVSVTPLVDEYGNPVPGMYVVVVCAKDRRQLLDAITRCVSQRASIIEATIITTHDGFALDRFVMKREEHSEHDPGSDASEEDVSFWGPSLKHDIEEVIGLMQPSPQLQPKRRSTARSIRPPSALAKPAWEVPIQEVRLIRVLGQGRTGRTFLAEWRGERVAAKVLNLADDNSSVMLEQFQSELALVSRLDHPNVVKCVGASARPPRYIILFELCEGDVLSMVKQRNKRFSFFQVALGAAQGLQYLHRNQVIHRDVKPENLMLDKQDRVKVVDFGLSCYVGEKQHTERTAETGTYRYMAPEVMLHHTYSFPADVFSFGLVMWCLLSRKVPFEEMTPLQTAMAVSRTNARPKMPANAPAAVASLIRACWDKDPAARPTFDGIIVALQTTRAALSKKEKAALDPVDE